MKALKSIGGGLAPGLLLYFEPPGGAIMELLPGHSLAQSPAEPAHVLSLVVELAAAGVDFQISAVELVSPAKQSSVKEMLEWIDRHGMPLNPDDFVVETTGDVARDTFLAAVKNRAVQDALLGAPYGLHGITTALCHAAKSTTDHPAYASGPQSFLRNQLKLVVEVVGCNGSMNAWAQDPPHQIMLADDAAECLAHFNAAMRCVTLEAPETLVDIVEQTQAVTDALRHSGCEHMGSQYIPMRIARAVLGHHTITEMSGVTIQQLRDISPDKKGGLDVHTFDQLDVSQFNWHGIQPHHWTMWVCIWIGKLELHNKYFGGM